MNKNKYNEIVDWCERLSVLDDPLSYEAYRDGRNGLTLRCYMPHDYPALDEGALFFFAEAADALEEEFNLRYIRHGWMDDHVWTVEFQG